MIYRTWYDPPAHNASSPPPTQARAEEREKVARWMIEHSYATGHGDTIEDLLVELVGGARAEENEACAKIAHKMEMEWFSTNFIAAAIRARRP